MQAFTDFRESFIKFEATNTERQKSIDNKLKELLEAQKLSVEHENTQVALITDLNNQVASLGEQVSALRESRNNMREKLNDMETEIEVFKTEKRMQNKFWAIASAVAILLSPIIAEFVGNWLTKGN